MLLLCQKKRSFPNTVVVFEVLEIALRSYGLPSQKPFPVIKPSEANEYQGYRRISSPGRKAYPEKVTGAFSSANS